MNDPQVSATATPLPDSRPSRVTEDPQFKVMAKLKPNKAGGECLCFTINMGILDLICIANVPGEGDSQAPVYVKFHVHGDERSELPQRTITAVIKENRIGGELLTFDLLFGFMKLSCIANVPEEGQDIAPVYVKVKVNEKRAPKWKRD